MNSKTMIKGKENHELSGENGTSILPLLTLREEKTGKYYNVLSKKTNVVGRAGFKCDLEVSNDLSVSRIHAEISVVKKLINEDIKLFIKVIDEKSKFGTFVNENIDKNVPVKKGSPVFLKLNDRIRFGMMGSIWIVQKYDLVVCPSSMNNVNKQSLNNMVTKIGGKIIKEWSEQCTHLCMVAITVTEKALLCLASGMSIVTLKYFIDLHKALSSSSMMELPYCVDYLPLVAENLLNSHSISFHLNNQRKTLFSGKTFLCSSAEQLNRISKIVKAAGGKTMVYFNCDESTDDILNSNEYIIMQQDPTNLSNSGRYLLILEKLEAMNKIPIPENNIALSIINASTEKHCNPNYNVTLVNLQSQIITASEQPVILAPETEICVPDESRRNSINTVPDSECVTNRNSVNTVPDSEFVVGENYVSSVSVIPDSECNANRNVASSENVVPDSQRVNNESQIYSVNVIPDSNCIFNENEVHSNNAHDSRCQKNNYVNRTKDDSINKNNNHSHCSTNENKIFSVNVVNSSQSQMQSGSKRTCEKLMNCEETETPKKRACLLSTKDDSVNEKQKGLSKMEVKDTSKRDVNISQCNNINKSFGSEQTEFSETLANRPSCSTDVKTNSKNTSCAKGLLSWLQITDTNKNKNNSNSSSTINAQNSVSTTRKRPIVSSIFNDEDDDLFNYKDLDEIEGYAQKKPKKANVESLFCPMVTTPSSNNFEHSKTVEQNSNQAVDPNFIMNLLAEPKNTGQFIDTNDDSLYKSSESTMEDSKNDPLNSVITETVNLTVSRCLKVQIDVVQGSNSTGKNFKKFIRKEPTMQIPNIISLALD